MSTRSFIARALAAVKARPRSWLGGVAAVLLVVAVVSSFRMEPRLVPSVAEAAALNPPYRSDVDARTAVEAGQARAAASGKTLMVVFGANWCPDCLTLWGSLRESDCRSYVEQHLEIVRIDVGDAEKSAAVKRDLGIEVNVIPLAVFYSPDGERLGDTLRGELKSSRHFSSRQIRDFLREVVDYRRIVSPDQRQ